MTHSTQVFVAYPYAFSKSEYRGAFERVGEEFGVDFSYADAAITNKQILDKIVAMIKEADFSIFDITTWNANVTLELGVARGAERTYYILFNPTVGATQVPSDLGGLDRMQYTSYAELEKELTRLMRQELGPPLKEREEQAAAMATAERIVRKAAPGRRSGLDEQRNEECR